MPANRSQIDKMDILEITTSGLLTPPFGISIKLNGRSQVAYNYQSFTVIFRQYIV